MSHGTDFDLALYQATGLFPNDFDTAWRGRTYALPLWIQNFSADTTLLAGTGLIILIGALKKRRDYLKIRPEWEIEEQVHQALVKEVVVEAIKILKMYDSNCKISMAMAMNNTKKFLRTNFNI